MINTDVCVKVGAQRLLFPLVDLYFSTPSGSLLRLLFSDALLVLFKRKTEGTSLRPCSRDGNGAGLGPVEQNPPVTGKGAGEKCHPHLRVKNGARARTCRVAGRPWVARLLLPTPSRAGSGLPRALLHRAASRLLRQRRHDDRKHVRASWRRPEGELVGRDGGRVTRCWRLVRWRRRTCGELVGAGGSEPATG